MTYTLDSIKEGLIAQLVKGIEWTLDVAPFDFQLIYKTANSMPLWAWKTVAIAQSATSGFALVAIPGIGVTAGLAADIGALLYAMALTSFGVGAKIAKKNGYSYSYIDRADYVDILALWVGAPECMSDGVVKATVMNTIFQTCGKSTMKATAKTSAVIGTAGTMGFQKGGAKMGSKFITKIATKLAAKLGIKAGVAIPVAGGLLNAGANGYFVGDIMNSAEQYYEAKFSKK